MDEEIPYNELLVDVEDGIVVGLYHYLWLKDGKGRACPDVNIPHTIVISNGRPKVWYFTSGKERCIKRKNRANMTNATITEALAPRTKSDGNVGASMETVSTGGGLGSWGGGSSPQRQQQQPKPTPVVDMGGVAGRNPEGNTTGNNLGPWPNHGVVARFQGSMTLPHNFGGGNGRGTSFSRRRKGTQFELQDESVEFFNREQLSEMLPLGHAVVHGVAALHEGVLQRFVQPRGQHHFSIRATWSPNACVVERRTNKAKLNDPRVQLADRLASWDGPNWLSEHTLITGTVLHGNVCRLCDNVAAHLADVSGGSVRVLRMVLFFSVDDANRIWLTHCATLKTQRLREMAFASPMGIGSNAHLQLAPRLRPGSGPLSTSQAAAAFRLRRPDSPGASDPGLELPAPSPAFMASKVAAKSGGGDDDDGSPGTSGRFLCVLTGEMYPASQRCDVTYKQLLQHWFSLASQLPNEGDRLRAMDTIPLAIRRANPSLTREWYLRVRSQPTFLYRTAPVCAEAAGQITGLALDELQRTVRPPGASGSGAVAGAGPELAAPVLGGGRAMGHREVVPVALAGGLGRPATTRVPVAVALGRQRPTTAMPLPLGQAHSARPGSRQLPTGSGVTRSLVQRSKSASPSMLAPRLVPSGGGGTSGGGGGLSHASAKGSSTLPSMLLPRDNTGGGLGPQTSSLFQVYGPTPEQAAEAAASAAALPYEVLDEARQAAEGDKLAYDESQASPSAAADSQLASANTGTPRGPGAAGSTPAVNTSGSGPAAAGPGSTPASGRQGGNGGPGATSPMWGGASSTRAGSRRNHMRMSTCSDATEIGSNGSNSEPTSPNGTHQGYHHPHQQLGGGGGSAGGSTRMSPPRSAGVLTLHTIHEEGATAPPRPDSPLGGAELLFPPPRGAGSQSVPRMRPPTRGGTDRPSAPGINSSGRRHGGPTPYSHHNGSGAANRHYSESGELPQLAGPGGGSLNSTMASSIGSASRRSTNTQAVLSTDDMRTLRELSEAYTAAERLTQQLLAQAHEILSEDGSRPGSTGNSPMHGGRKQSPQGISASSRSGGRPDSGAGEGSGAGSGPVGTRLPSSNGMGSGGGSGSGVRAGNTSGRPTGMPLPAQRPSSSLGPSPLGQTHLSRQGSGRAGSVGSSDGIVGAERSSQSSVQPLPPVLVRVPSGSNSAQEGGMPDTGSSGGGGMAVNTPGDMSLLTSAEADLLAEALQE